MIKKSYPYVSKNLMVYPGDICDISVLQFGDRIRVIWNTGQTGDLSIYMPMDMWSELCAKVANEIQDYDVARKAKAPA